MPEILEARIAPAILADLFQFANAAGTVELVETDSAGNIYLAGTFTGSVTADTRNPLVISTSDPLGDIYYAKLSPLGFPLWLQRWGGPGLETLGDIKTDENGDLFVTGSFDSSGAGFGGSGPLATTAGSPQMFLFKASQINGTAATAFSSDGQFQFGSAVGNANGNSLAIGASNTIYVGGAFSGSVDIGNGVVTADATDGFVLSLDQDSAIFSSGFASPTFGVLTSTISTDTNDKVFRLVVSDTGSLFVGIDSLFINAVPPIPPFSGILKFDGASGAVDTSFNGGTPLIIGSDGAKLDFDVDASNRVLAALTNAGGASNLSVFRFDAAGQIDTLFGNTGGHFINVDALSVRILLDAQDRIYVGGVTPTADFIARISANGLADPIFGSSNFATFTTPGIFGKHTSVQNANLGMALDPNGFLILRDGYTGATGDLDPTSGIRKLAARTGLGSGMEETFIARIDLNAVGSGQTVRIFAGIGPGGVQQEILVTLSGPGGFRLGAVDETGSIDSIELFDTTLASTLNVATSKLVGTRTIGKILAQDTQQHVGAIKLAPALTLGLGLPDSSPDLLITGRVNSLVLGDVNQNSIIKLGVDLLYNVPNDTTTPDTYNNRPTLSIGVIQGPGVIIENIGDGTPQGVGGGGFGNIVIESWAFPGFLRTTQSIGNFTIQKDDFMAVLEIDKFGHGEETMAGTGTMTVQNGAWGSSGNEVEGYVSGFNADEFLAGASITAGGIGKIITDQGDFNGTLTLTDAAASAVPIFTVATDFTGTIVSASPLKKIVIKGNFKGSLTAPSIAAITAFSFFGDEDGDTIRKNITTTAGLLGLITAKSGVVKDFEFHSMAAPFSGIKVSKTKLTNSTVGVENVTISAPTIGPITVSLSASPGAPGVNLTGILNSSFSATAAGNASVGAVNVKLSGANGASVGLTKASFAGDTIGNVLVNVSKGKDAGATARAVDIATFTADEVLGNFTVLGAATQAQVNKLTYVSGGKVGSVNIKSVKSEFATLENSTILAGQSLDFTGATTDAELKAKLLAASLKSFNAAGGVTSSLIAAGASIGPVTVGGALSDSLILAGTRLGADRVLGGGNDAFQRAAKITALTVKGAYSKTSVAAGVDPVNGIFGDVDDVLGVSDASAVQGSEIGTVSIGGGAVGTVTLSHTFAIEAAKIAKLLVKGQPPVKDFTLPSLLDIGAPGEDATDVIVRVL